MGESEKKPFGRYHDFVLLVVGFFLTTIAGSFIQHRFASAQAQNQLVEAQRVAATTVFDEVSRLIDRRAYTIERLALAIRFNLPPAQMDTIREQALDAREDAEVSFNRNRALICRYFGFTTANQFFHVSNRLDALDFDVTPSMPTSQDRLRVTSDSVLVQIVPVGDMIYMLNDAMVERIRSGRVGDRVAREDEYEKCELSRNPDGGDDG